VRARRRRLWASRCRWRGGGRRGLVGSLGGGRKGEWRFGNERRGLQVAVKVDHAHGTVFSVYAAQ